MKIQFFVGKKGIEEYSALKKVYKNVDLIKPQESFFFSLNISNTVFWHFSSKIFEPILNQYILSKIKKSYDLIFVRDGDFIGKKLILKLKLKTKKIIFFCHDNPFVSRDYRRFDLCLPALKHYDFMIFLQSSRIALSKKFGIKKSFLVLPYYEKKIHYPRKINLRERKKFTNDVIFIGTWMPERGIFFNKLIKMGLNLQIYGMNWEKDKNLEYLKSHINLGQVSLETYIKLIQCAKIALCIPSQRNLDDISARSIEIPAIGTLLCAIRTKIHEKILVENKEAIFFKNEKECYNKCQNLLLNPKKLEKIAHKGHVKITKVLKANSENMVKKIIYKVFPK